MEQILMTKNGLQAFEEKRSELMKKLKAIQGQKGEAAEIGGNVWHDNFSFEELVRQENVLNKQLRDIRDILDAAVIVPNIPSGTETLQVGHIAHLYIEDDDITKVIQIGGFGESDLNAKPPIIDYSAPIVKPFYGQEEGHEVAVQLGGINKNIVLVTIELRKIKNA